MAYLPGQKMSRQEISRYNRDCAQLQRAQQRYDSMESPEYWSDRGEPPDDEEEDENE